MKLVIIRHGDPDYVHDSLTEKGVREAECLAERVKKLKIDKCFVSPLGRAKKTAEIGLGNIGITPVTLNWLQEVPTLVARPHDPESPAIAWDWLPKDWTIYEDFYSYDRWLSHPAFEQSNLKADIEKIYQNFDELLASLGYKKNGKTFQALHANNDTIVFYCHFGLECVLLSYLLSISPMVLWHNFCARTTSVTTVVTEERVKGEAMFRVIELGDTSHLYASDEPCSFAARFCECYDNADERH